MTSLVGCCTYCPGGSIYNVVVMSYWVHLHHVYQSSYRYSVLRCIYSLVLSGEKNTSLQLFASANH